MRKALVIGNLRASIPVIQGGMGVGVSLSKLAGNVAKCGGIGIISTAQIGYQEPGFEENPIETNLKAIGKHIQRAKEIAQGGIVGVNIMVATKRYEDYVKAAVKAGADLVISGAGLPTMLPALVEKSKTKIAPIVSSVKSAAVICKLWDRKYNDAQTWWLLRGQKQEVIWGSPEKNWNILLMKHMKEKFRESWRLQESMVRNIVAMFQLWLLGEFMTVRIWNMLCSLGQMGYR